jgi:hypothetical protein
MLMGVTDNSIVVFTGRLPNGWRYLGWAGELAVEQYDFYGEAVRY